MEQRRDAFHAIADPTRRQILELVVRGPLNVNTIAENFDMSRQAVSLHVKVLEECGLVVIRQQGRERFCEADLGRLNEVADWVAYLRQFWGQQFKSLDKYLAKVQAVKKKK